MKKLIYILLIVLSAPVFARQFHVEMIVFKRNINPAQVSESWPNVLPALDFSNTVSLVNSPNLAAKGVKMMPASQFQLNGLYNKLKQHAGFTPLAHFGWTEGNLGRASAPVFHFEAGKTYPATNDSQAQRELEGRVQVYVQHYLFVNAQMNLKEPAQRTVAHSQNSTAPSTTEINATESNGIELGNLSQIKPATTVENWLKTYRFSQLKKMGSGEIHYLDNPLMGIIIQVRKTGN